MINCIKGSRNDGILTRCGEEKRMYYFELFWCSNRNIHGHFFSTSLPLTPRSFSSPSIAMHSVYFALSIGPYRLWGRIPSIHASLEPRSDNTIADVFMFPKMTSVKQGPIIKHISRVRLHLLYWSTSHLIVWSAKSLCEIPGEFGCWLGWDILARSNIVICISLIFQIHIHDIFVCIAIYVQTLVIIVSFNS